MSANEAVFDEFPIAGLCADKQKKNAVRQASICRSNRDSKNIMIANMHIYRVVSSYQPASLCDSCFLAPRDIHFRQHPLL